MMLINVLHHYNIQTGSIRNDDMRNYNMIDSIAPAKKKKRTASTFTEAERFEKRCSYLGLTP